MGSGDFVYVLNRDHDLADQLSNSELGDAHSHSRTRALRYPRGPWVPGEATADMRSGLGLLVLDGVLVRKVSVGERACAEILGPGDILQPWVQTGRHDSVHSEVNWEAMQPVSVAVLDRHFIVAVARWPQLVATLSRRIMLRIDSMAFYLAICHIRRVEERLTLVLWHLADRWGQVTPRGVEIGLTLPHRLLGELVGARRPAVTLALGALAQAGTVQPRPRSRWTLHGEPPEVDHQMLLAAAHRDLHTCSKVEREFNATAEERRFCALAEHPLSPTR